MLHERRVDTPDGLERLYLTDMELLELQLANRYQVQEILLGHIERHNKMDRDPAYKYKSRAIQEVMDKELNPV